MLPAVEPLLKIPRPRNAGQACEIDLLRCLLPLGAYRRTPRWMTPDKSAYRNVAPSTKSELPNPGSFATLG